MDQWPFWPISVLWPWIGPFRAYFRGSRHGSGPISEVRGMDLKKIFINF